MFKKIFKKSFGKDNFCILLTATIDPNNCIFTKRSDPKVREQDYLQSLELWLINTNLKIVFCENSGYNLKNIISLASKYPGRVEIVKFNGNNYPRNLGKGYGEMKIIERALSESKFIQESECIIKVTGRIFIKNIYKIIKTIRSNTFIQYRFEPGVYSLQTVIFFFKKDFFWYLKKYAELIDDAKGLSFEGVFKIAMNDARIDKNKCEKMIKPIYVGYSGTNDMKYEDIFKTSRRFLILDGKIGRMGLFIKKHSPILYNLFKPYFPDKK